MTEEWFIAGIIIILIDISVIASMFYMFNRVTPPTTKEVLFNIKHRDSKCPKCDSNEIVELREPQWEECECKSCGEAWSEKY